MRVGRCRGLRSAHGTVAHGSDARRDRGDKTPKKVPLSAPSDRPPVPGAGRRAGRRSSCSRCSSCFSRAASRVAGYRVDGHGDRNADAFAAPRAGHRSRVAGPGRGVQRDSRTAATASRPISTRCRRGGTVKGVDIEAAEDETLDQDPGGHQGALGPRRANTERLIDNRQNLTDARQGHRDDRRRARTPRRASQQAARSRAGRRHATRDRVREPARERWRSGSRRMRPRCRVGGDRPRGRVGAGQGHRHVSRRPAAPSRAADAPRVVGSRDEEAPPRSPTRRSVATAYEAGVAAIPRTWTASFRPSRRHAA